jgi:ABC transporter DrrB family efflux protein
MARGIMDRFRSLPMNKASILTGTIVSDMIKNLLAIAVMVATGLLVGFRPEASFLDWLAVLGLLLSFSFAISWVFAFIGMTGKSIEFVQQMGFLFLFPLTSVSSAFVKTETMPKALQYFAANQPVTQVVDAVRALLLNTPIGNHGWIALAWSFGIFAVVFPLTIRTFNRQGR